MSPENSPEKRNSNDEKVESSPQKSLSTKDTGAVENSTQNSKNKNVESSPQKLLSGDEKITSISTESFYQKSLSEDKNKKVVGRPSNLLDYQRQTLQENFPKNPYPTSDEIQKLSKCLGMKSNNNLLGG